MSAQIPQLEELLQEAITNDLGVGSAPTKILAEAKSKEQKYKALKALSHAIGWTPGQYLEPKHLNWRRNWKTLEKNNQNARI